MITFTSEKPKITVRLLEKDYQFQDGVLSLDPENPEHQSLILDMRMKLAHPDYAGLAQLVRELPTDVAEQVVARHREMRTLKGHMGVGGLNGGSLDAQARVTGVANAALEDQMRSNGASDEQIAEAAQKLADDGLALTVRTEGQPVHRASGEGFIPLKSDNQGDVTAKISLPVNVVVPPMRKALTLPTKKS